MNSTDTLPAAAAPAEVTTIYHVPEDVWVLHLFDYLDSLALSRLAPACSELREYVSSYRNSCAYGRRLALEGLRRVRELLIASHTECAGCADLDKLTESVDAYVPRLCVSYHDLPPATPAMGSREGPGRRHAHSLRKQRIAAAVGGRKFADIVKTWGRAEIAIFLAPFATQLGSDWGDASAAISWALWALNLDTLRHIIFASEPCAVLAEKAKTPEQEAIAHMIRAILVLRGIPTLDEEKAGSAAEYMRAKDAGLLTITQAALNYTDGYTARVGSKDPACLEFALAGGALAINYSLKAVPKLRHQYIQAIHTCLEAGRLRTISTASKTVLKSLGLLGPARRVSALKDFRCNLSAPNPDNVGAALAEIFAMAPTGAGHPAAVMLGPGGNTVPVPSTILAALLMGPAASGSDDDDDHMPPYEDYW